MQIKAAGKCVAGGFFIRTLIFITIAAWLLRVFASWEMANAAGGINNVFTPPPTSDLATYMTLGKACAAGNFPAEFYYQPYYYAVFLAAIYFVFGNISVYAVIFIQSLLSAATVFITGICGRKIFSPAAGIIAAGLVAVSSSLILYVPFHQNETLQTFHLILLFYFVIKSCESRKLLDWAISGIICGIAILTRGNVWIILPAILTALFLSEKSCRKWKFFGIFMLCMIAVQLPFIIKNSTTAGSLRGTSTAADAVLAIGNGIDAPAGGREPGTPAGSMYYSEAYRRMMANVSGEFALGVPEQMCRWFIDDPAGFVELQFRKALLFWDGREIPNNVSLQYDGMAASSVLRGLILGRNHILIALGLGGIFWFLPRAFSRHGNGKIKLLYAFTALFYFSVVIFYILSRFKAPLLPFLAVFGGGAVCEWKEAWKEKSWRLRFYSTISLFAGMWFTTQAYDLYRAVEPAVWRCIHPHGIIMDLHGKNILHFDHGPQPFGAWLDVAVKRGMVIRKQFSSIRNAPAEIEVMMRNFESASVTLVINGKTFSFTLPPIIPGKSERKMVRLPGFVIDGALNILVADVSGGEVFVTFDNQRQYGRSFLNGNSVVGEWVIRAGIPRGF